MSQFMKNAYVTWSALTRGTEKAAKVRGTRYFLPALFVDRFANLGGIDKALFAKQLDECDTFEDDGWTTYWRGLANDHIAAADLALATLGAPTVAELLDADNKPDLTHLGDLLAPAVSVFADRTPENGPTIVAQFELAHPDDLSAARAIDELVKAMAYLFAAAWPGWTDARMAAYTASQRIFHVLMQALAPAMGGVVERIELDLDGEDVVAYGVFPNAPSELPTVLVTNGLEGTIQEALVPALRHRHQGIAVVTMEMPGTFQYTKPLTVDSERIYAAVLEQLAAHPRVDAGRIGMMGISFGAHWSTRMAAARNPHLKAVVSNGGLYHRSFGAAALFGMPEIMIWTLQKTVAAKNLPALGHKLKALSLKRQYANIEIPILVINGDTDTLISTKDSVDLANLAPNAELLLYPDDDHCAMGHYTEWLDQATEWLGKQLI